MPENLRGIFFDSHCIARVIAEGLFGFEWNHLLRLRYFGRRPTVQNTAADGYWLAGEGLRGCMHSS